MIVTAVLCWFDEPVELLDRCVRSLAGVCDRLVAVDGRWEGFPGDRVASGQEQRETIREAAAAVGVEGIIVVPRAAPFSSQVAKRSAAVSLVRFDSDWLLVIDADEHVRNCDRVALGELLEATDADVAAVPLTNLERTWPHDQLPEQTYTVRRLFRVAADPLYSVAHDGVVDRQGRWLSGDERHVDLVAAADASSVISLGHAGDERPADRHAQRDVYYRTRRAEKLEDWTFPRLLHPRERTTT